MCLASLPAHKTHLSVSHDCSLDGSHPDLWRAGGERVERVKETPTDPHKHSLHSFIYGPLSLSPSLRTPSLLKAESQTLTTEQSPPPTPPPPTPCLPTAPTHIIHTHIVTVCKYINTHSHGCTYTNRHTSTHTHRDAHTGTHTHSHRHTQAHTSNGCLRWREVNITLLPRMQWKFILPLEGREASWVSLDEQLSFSTNKIDTRPFF